MRVSSRLDIPGVMPAIIQPQPEAPPLSWPLAAAVICGLSVGLWVLGYRLFAFLSGL